VLVEELTFLVTVYAYIAVQAKYLSTPKHPLLVIAQRLALDIRLLDEFLESSRTPELPRKVGILDLISVIHAHGISLSRLARGCHKWKGRQECDVVFGQTCCP